MVSRLELTKASNGGWIVSEPGERQGYIPQFLAAYSNTADLLEGLAERLQGDHPLINYADKSPGAVQYVDND